MLLLAINTGLVIPAMKAAMLSDRWSETLQEVALALGDRHHSLIKRPELRSDDIRDIPHTLVKLMQQCWHKVCVRVCVCV